MAENATSGGTKKHPHDLPDFRGLAASRMEELADLPATLMGGTVSMRDSGKSYLPKWPREKEEDYAERLGQAILANFFKKAVGGLVGRVFSKPISLEDDILPQFADTEDANGWLANVDLQGNDLTSFAREVAREAWTRGSTYILAEMPPFPTDEDGNEIRPDAATERMTRRPYLVHVRQSDLLGFRYEVPDQTDASFRLTQVRVREREVVPSGAFGEREVERVRVLEPGRWELWEDVRKEGSEEPDWEKVEEGTTTLDFIPLVPVYGEFESFMVGRPPLLDLAHLNVAHFQSYSDQRNILHFARLPIWCLFGVPTGEVPEGSAPPFSMEGVGPGVIWKFSNPDSKAMVLEHGGAAIEQGWKDLTELELKMALMALDPLLPKQGEVTATTHMIQTADAHSALQMFAIHLEDALESCLDAMAALAFPGKGLSGGSVSVNRDFGITAQDAERIRVVVDLALAGKFPLKRAFDELVRYNIVGPAFDSDEAISELEGDAATAQDVQRIEAAVRAVGQAPAVQVPNGQEVVA